jgi:hypothetical protein
MTLLEIVKSRIAERENELRALRDAIVHSQGRLEELKALAATIEAEQVAPADPMRLLAGLARLAAEQQPSADLDRYDDRT